MTIDTCREAVERLDTHRVYIDRTMYFNEGITWTTVAGLYPHAYVPEDFALALLARAEAAEAERAAAEFEARQWAASCKGYRLERDAALAEVTRLSTPPDDAEVVLLSDRATEIDPVLEVDFDTQLDVERNPYGAREAIETALHLIRDQADAVARLSQALAAERKLADDAKRLLDMAQDRCGHNFVGAEYPTFVDFCDAHAARRNEETLAKHGSKT